MHFDLRDNPRLHYLYTGDWKERIPFYGLVLVPTIALAAAVAYIVAILDTTNAQTDRIWGTVVVLLAILLWQRCLPIGAAHAKVARQYKPGLRIVLFGGGGWLTYYSWTFVVRYLDSQLRSDTSVPNFTRLLAAIVVMALPLIGVLINLHWVPSAMHQELEDGTRVKQARTRRASISSQIQNDIQAMLWRAGQIAAQDPESGETRQIRPIERRDYEDMAGLSIKLGSGLQALDHDMQEVLGSSPKITPLEGAPKEDDPLKNYSPDRIRRSPHGLH